MVGNSRNSLTEEIREEPWGEQYFPGLTEHEFARVTVSSNGPLATVAGKVRKYPWRCLGVAVGVGALLGIVVRPSCGTEMQD